MHTAKLPRPRSPFKPMDSAAARLYELAFSKPREPRSGAYKAGVLASLRGHETGAHQACPYPSPSAERDAWYSGTYEGNAIWGGRLDEERN